MTQYLCSLMGETIMTRLLIQLWHQNNTHQAILLRNGLIVKMPFARQGGCFGSFCNIEVHAEML